MARKKAQRKQEAATQLSVLNLRALLDQAAFGNVRQLQAFLNAGGSPNAQVDLMSGSASLQVSLIHAIIITTQPPYS
eukprot:16038-Heterococcus_DN1.PRE.5